MFLLSKKKNIGLIGGAGIEKHISYERIADIVYDYFEPYFNEKDYDKAVKITFDKLHSFLANAYGTKIEEVYQKINEKAEKERREAEKAAMEDKFFHVFMIFISVV